MHSPLRRILVGVGPDSDPATLAAASALALRDNARLTVLAAIVRPPSLTWMAPMAPPFDPVREADDECVRRLRAALAQAPAGVSVTGIVRRGRAHQALLEELRTGAHDLLVVGAGRRGRVARAVLRAASAPVLVTSAG